MTNAKDKLEKQEELKSCPVAAALAPVRQLQKGEQVSALIFEGGGTKGAAYAGVVKALDAAGLVKDVKHFAGASAGAMTAAILAAGHDGPALAKFIKEAPWEKLMKNISYLKVVGLASQFALKSGGSAIQTFLEEKVFTHDHFKELAEKEGWTAKFLEKPKKDWGRITLGELADYRGQGAAGHHDDGQFSVHRRRVQAPRGQARRRSMPEPRGQAPEGHGRDHD